MAALGTAAPPAGAHPPPFYWMGDVSGESRAGVSLLAGTTEQVTSDAILIGADVFAELQVSDSIAILGRVPFTYADYELVLADPLVIEESAFALGNISLGAQFSSIGQIGEYMTTRLGGGFLVALPTASDSDEAGLAASITSAFFLPDPGRYLPNATSIRLRGDVRAEADLVFFQGELALDVHVLDGEGDDPKELVLGAGMGVMLSPYFALLAELTTRADVLDDAEERGESFLHVLDAGMRYHDGNVMAGFRLYVPLDKSLRDAEMIGFGADLAARF